MKQPKTIDDIICEIFAAGALSGNGIPQEASQVISESKQALVEWVRSKKPANSHKKVDESSWGDICQNIPATADDYEQALLADLEEVQNEPDN